MDSLKKGRLLLLLCDKYFWRRRRLNRLISWAMTHSSDSLQKTGRMAPNFNAKRVDDPKEPSAPITEEIFKTPVAPLKGG